jgi:hypothetical protein
MRASYLSVRNLDRYQHYKRRNPPWVKFYASVLDDYEMNSLPEATRWLAIGLIILASRNDNRIPNDPEWIAQRLTLTTPPDLEALRDIGFIVTGRASKMLAARKQNAPSETETETETETENTGAIVLAHDARDRLPAGRTPKPKTQSPEARAEATAYGAMVGWPVTDRVYRAVHKWLVQGRGPELEAARQAYARVVHEKDTPREYRIRPHNWFGRDARWMEYAGRKDPAAPGECARCNSDTEPGHPLCPSCERRQESA